MRFLLFFTSLLFYLFCAKAPDKVDPPYLVLQYLKEQNSSVNENPQNALDSCGQPTGPFSPGALFDTGFTTCWAGTIATLCANTGQDGEYNNIPNARTFSGPTQHCQYSADYTTLDTLHGLTWKTCAQGQSGSNCATGGPISISWDDATGGLPGSCADLNTQSGGKGYAGKTNWRIPNIREAASLIHYGNNPHFDTTRFPNTFSGNHYLSVTNNALGAGTAWAINIALPSTGAFTIAKNLPVNLRCVSGNPLPALSLLDNGNQTVTDSNTGLLWAQCQDGTSGPGCAGGGAAIWDWNQALNACNTMNFAGRNDWRLPNVNELQSIIDYNQGFAPVVPNIIFPGITPGLFWTSTTFDNDKNLAHVVDLSSGQIATNDKASTLNVLCVTTN
ncbi:DUF1566 domain-containing protein [Leptospira yasudae]|uniref:DUF1566 domain-containing protein n=1 Tax=Leptospira yasudae TaxID=2202201 RepID=A0A6N4QQT0_9LEPT|nr:DUF1566 domain-containing protein [Leptospira yasudae]TGL82131.1 DUF1566 domain-containing protein [Leptospira yasudae]TGL83228.1 DUF1566 domain-containing protein [Leptospira yasudae]TGL87488.1 DUF1566 domain-containing protein [Leptospira yasudae]